MLNDPLDEMIGEDEDDSECGDVLDVLGDGI